MHDHDAIDFGMLDLPTRPGPAKASAAPEQDSVEKRLDEEREAAPFRECRLKWEQRALKPEATVRVHMERTRVTIERGEEMHRGCMLDSVADLTERERFVRPLEITDDEVRARFATVEVKHGSGKVKV